MIVVVGEALADVAVGAVLRPTRSDWSPTTREVRALDLSAGPDWLERCSAQGDLPVGSAAITEPGGLACEFVIHLAVCSRDEPVGSRSVSDALRNALRRATEWDVRVLTTPVLGTGPGALEPSTACGLMRPLLSTWVGGLEGRTVRVAAAAAEREAARSAWGAG
jgi:O-acetyl-ADP-ribose deacetylase (regulator of RNase III)